MKKKAKKVPSKSQKASKKPVVKKKPATKAKKAKPASKKPVAKKKPVVKKAKSAPKKIVKPSAKKAAKPVLKVVAKKAVAPVATPTPKKVAEKLVPVAKAAKPAPAPAKAPVRKLTPAEIVKLGLKPLPKALPSQVKDDKKPKGYYTLEYVINSSPDVLFDFISSASGLEKWFAEKVNVKDNLFHFEWENDETKEARMIALKEREFARFHWIDQKDNNKFFEFRIQIDDLTSEVALIVSDFADTKEDYEDARLLWNAQINDLLHAIGGAP